MPKQIRFKIFKTKAGYHQIIHEMMQNQLVSYYEKEKGSWNYVIIGRYGTNKEALRKELDTYLTTRP